MDLPVNLAPGTVITTLNLKEPAKIIQRFYPKIRTFHHMMLVLTPTNRHLSAIIPNPRLMSELNKQLLSLRSKKRHLRPTGLIKEPGPSIIGYPGCLAGVTRLYIDASASVKPCCMASEYVLGNLKTQSFEDIWFSDATERIRNEPIPLCHQNA